MYAYAHDGVSNAVMLLVGGSLDARDLERYRAAIKELDRMTNGREDTVVVVIFEDETLPTALSRKAMAEATQGLRTRPIRVVVSPSPLARTIITAVSWLRRQSPFADETIVATVPDAIAWVEARRGPRRLIIERLIAKARENAAADRLK